MALLVLGNDYVDSDEGGSIGAGLFVGSGSALRNGGPASLVIGFIIIGRFFLLLRVCQMGVPLTPLS